MSALRRPSSLRLRRRRVLRFQQEGLRSENLPRCGVGQHDGHDRLAERKAVHPASHRTVGTTLRQPQKRAGEWRRQNTQGSTSAWRRPWNVAPQPTPSGASRKSRDSGRRRATMKGWVTVLKAADAAARWRCMDRRTWSWPCLASRAPPTRTDAEAVLAR